MYAVMFSRLLGICFLNTCLLVCSNLKTKCAYIGQLIFVGDAMFWYFVSFVDVLFSETCEYSDMVVSFDL